MSAVTDLRIQRSLALWRRLQSLWLALVVVVPSALRADDQTAYTIDTGNSNGVDFAFGQWASRAWADAGIPVVVRSSAGSRQNLERLAKGESDLCLAQSDTLHDAFNGSGQFHERMPNIRAIASVFSEAVHVVVRSPLRLRRLEDLRGKRVAVGPTGSGTAANALEMLETAGLTSGEFQMLQLDNDAAFGRLREGSVDAVFLTSSFPSPQVAEALRTREAYLLEPRPEILENLLADFPFFVVTTIPARTYVGQNEDITTIGVATILAVRGDLPAELVQHLAKTILDSPQGGRNLPQGLVAFRQDQALEAVTIPIHGGADRYFKEAGYYSHLLLKRLLMHYAPLLVLVSVVVLAIVKFKRIRKYFQGREIFRVICTLCVIWVVGSVSLYYAEHRINDSYATLMQACWSALINWISFGAKEPFTVVGRITSVSMTILGVGGVVWITGEIASFFMYKKFLGGNRILEKLKNHYVIVNWNNKGPGIIEQLRNPEVEQHQIVIVTNVAKDALSLDDHARAIYHVQRGALGEALLRGVGVVHARSVIVLADSTKQPHEADNDTVLVILALRKIFKAENASVPIVAEIVAPEQVQLAKFVGAWGDGDVEIVSSSYLAQNMLAQVAVTPGLTKVYEDLLVLRGSLCLKREGFKGRGL